MLNGVNLYLIGMMGVGKTTIGRLLAEQLNYQFIDTDEVIEQATGQSIPTIFAESGEEIFRQLETATLSQVASRTSKVIATGGGIVLKRENWGFLRHGVIVWLDVPVAQLQERLKSDTNRPLLQDTDLEERLNKLSAERRSLYAQADIQIAIATETPEQITERVMAAIAAACEAKRQEDDAIARLNTDLPFQLDQN